MTATDDYTAVHRIMGVVFGETQAPWSAPFDTADGRRRSGELLGHRERCLPRCRYQRDWVHQTGSLLDACERAYTAR